LKPGIIAPDCQELLDSDATFIKGQVTGIDLSSQTVSVKGHDEPLRYHVLVISPGASRIMPAWPALKSSPYRSAP
jgi:NADH dehydrogenase FAD-containing subunit